MFKRHCGRMQKAAMLFMCALIVAFGSTNAPAGQMVWPISISYVDGITDLVDRYESNLAAEFGSADSWEWPVGIALQPYYQWDNGLRLGVDVGPFILMFGDADHYQIPLNVNVGYTVGLSGPLAFYFKVGPSYHIASGDYEAGSDVGVMAAVGLEFIRLDHFLMGVQIAYDSAEVDINGPFNLPPAQSIKVAEYTVGLFFAFK